MEQRDLINELGSAARGCWGILMGDRIAANQIDGSLGGVATSFIPLLIALALQAMFLLPLPADVIAPPTVFVLLHLLAISIAGFAGVYGYLRARGAMIVMEQYIVAHNWSNLFFLVIALVLSFLLPGMIGSTIMFVATTLFYFRAASFLLGINGPDVILMIGAQFLTMVAGVIALMILGMIIPGIGFQVVVS